jgi:hypothetical protein
MALGTPAWAAGSATIPTRVGRHLPAALTGVPVISHANSATATTRGGGYGVAGGGDLAVTSTGGLGYSFAVGHFGLPGTSATAQGMYVDYNDAVITGNLPARNATNPYIAYLGVLIRDTDEDATGFEDATPVVIQGVAGATPSPPAVPSSLGSLLIASEAFVPSAANGGPVTFTERRQYLNAIGGIQRVTSATRPTGAALWDGQAIFETDTKRLFVYNATASAMRGIRPAYYSVVGTANSGVSAITNVITGTLPATGCSGNWVVTITMMFTITAAGSGWESGVNDGSTTYGLIRTGAIGSLGDFAISYTAQYATSTGTSVPVFVYLGRVLGTGTATTYADSKSSRLDAIFIPDP